MPDDPCQNERENFYVAVEGATAAGILAVALAPETVGLSMLVGALTGATGGTAIGVAHNQWARCLRDHGMTAEADVLDGAAAQLTAELEQLNDELIRREGEA